MQRFDVYELKNGPMVLNVQSDYLDWIDTRLVIPLVPRKNAPPPAKLLNPIFEIQNSQLVLLTQAMSAISTQLLQKKISNLSAEQDHITRALDMVFQGF